MSRMREIVAKYGEEYMLRQLAEECCELAQAALKVIRAKHKETPMRESEAWERFLEELADVEVLRDGIMSAMLNPEEKEYVYDTELFKENRMYERMLDGEREEHVW